MAQEVKKDDKAETKGGTLGNLDKQIEQLQKCEYISEAEVKNLCQRAMEILMEESNVQRVDPPVIVTHRLKQKAKSKTQQKTKLKTGNSHIQPQMCQSVKRF